MLFRDSDKQFEPLARYKVADTPTWAHPVIAAGQRDRQGRDEADQMENPHVPDAPGDGNRPGGAVERSAGLTAEAADARARHAAAGISPLADLAGGGAMRGGGALPAYFADVRRRRSQCRHVADERDRRFRPFALVRPGQRISAPAALEPAGRAGRRGAAAAATLRIEQFNGSLVPRFRLRWRPPADTRLPAARAAQRRAAGRPDGDDIRTIIPSSAAAIATGLCAASSCPRLAAIRPSASGDIRSAPAGRHLPASAILRSRWNSAGRTNWSLAIESPRANWFGSQATPTRHESVLGGVGPRSTPTIHQGKVYALGATGRLHCLDGKDGRVVWEKNLLDEFGIADPEADMDNLPWGRAGSPLVVDDLVVVPAGGPKRRTVCFARGLRSRIGARSLAGRRTADQLRLAGLLTIWVEPTIVIVNESNVTGHDPGDRRGVVGRSLARFEQQRGHQFAMRCDRRSSAAGFQRLWRRIQNCSRSSEPATEPRAGRRTICGPSPATCKPNSPMSSATTVRSTDLSDGILECIAQETGDRRWKKEARYGHGQILLVGDTILVLDEAGELALVDANPKQFEQLGQIEALEAKPGTIWPSARPYLLIRNGQEAACYRLPLAGDGAESAAAVDRRALGGDNSRSQADRTGRAER